MIKLGLSGDGATADGAVIRQDQRVICLQSFHLIDFI